MNTTAKRTVGELSTNGTGTHTIKPLGREQQLMLELAKKYMLPNKTVDWVRAAAENPAIAKELRFGTSAGKAKLAFYMTRFRKAGLFDEKAPAAPAALPPAESNPQHIPAKYRTVYSIVTRYSLHDGSVDWATAWKENPALEQELLGNGNRAKMMQRLYQQVSTLRRKGLIEGPRLVQKRSKRQAKAEVMHEQPPEPAAPPLNFCPGCGLSLIPYLMAVRFAAKLMK